MTSTSTIRHAVADSPVGPLTLVDRDGRLGGLYMADQRHLPDVAAFGVRDDRSLPEVREQLTAYFAGELQEFDLPLAPLGTPFQREVWAALRRVPYGTTCTYGALAAAIGRPAAVRAVGAANGRNPIGIVVPCHRVVGSTGQLTGYAGGVDKKATLLALEKGETLF
jgi:methylated-DNA-[protein]-cysteine S-methyltransferase